MSLQAGQILADKYRIVKLLGKGGMGEVYEGENVRIRRRVAIKTLLSHVSEKPDVLARFEREAQAAGRIGSEHIVEVLDLGDLPDKSRFMVMEFCEGSTLSDRIISRGRIPPIEAARIVGELLEGLGAAHAAGIIHRDLKPANVFLLATKPNRPDFVKILDFGVSKFSVLGDEMSMTRTGAVVGTPYYMSPEQAKGAKFIDARSDLYSVGVILYETITGQVPFNAETFNELIFKIALESPPPPETFVPTLDPAFAAIIRKAMAREADDRFQTPAEFKAALEHWARGAAMATPTAIPAYAPVPSHAQAQAQNSLAAPPQNYGAYAPPNRQHNPTAATVVGAAPSPKLGGGTAMMDGRPGPGATVIAQAYATPPPPMVGAIPALPAVPNVLTAPVARPAPKKRSPVPIFAMVGVLVLGGAAAAILVLAKKPGDAQADTATATATTTAPAATTAAASPKPTATEAPTPSATTPLSAEPLASATPSAEPSAEPTPTSPIAMNPGTGGGFIPRPPPTNPPTSNPPPTTPTTATTPTGKPTGRTIDGSL